MGAQMETKKTSIGTFFRNMLNLRRQKSFFKSQVASKEFLKKETLTAKSIEAFLEHVLKGIVLREKSTSEFFKFLTISKGFLNVSHNYPVFELVLNNAYSENTMNVCFYYSPNLCYAFQLSNNFVKTFVQLLNPKFLYFVFGRINDQMMHEIREIMRSCSGKISLKIFDNQYDSYFLSILNEFANHLRRLMCKPDLLTKTIASKLKLENYDAKQAEFILRTLKTNQLELFIRDVRFNETVMTGLSSQICNYAITHLSLEFRNCSMNVLDKFSSSLLQICPKLQRLELEIISVAGSFDDEFDPDRIVEKALDTRKWFNQLEIRFSQLNYFQLILSYGDCCSPDQYNDAWMNELKSHKEFKKAQDQIFNREGIIFNEIKIMEENDKSICQFYITVYHDFLNDEN